MSSKRRRKKPYRDPYGKYRPLKPGQGRCMNRICSCAVWLLTLVQYEGKCPNCHDRDRLRELYRYKEIVL